MECHYKKVDRWLKEQFLHGQNDSEMLIEIIRGLTKSDENKLIPSGHVLTWQKELKLKEHMWQ